MASTSTISKGEDAPNSEWFSRASSYQRVVQERFGDLHEIHSAGTNR